MEDAVPHGRGDSRPGRRVRLGGVPDLLVLILALALTSPLLAQENPEREEDRARLSALETEIASLRERMAQQEARASDEDLQADRVVNIYGDIGFRYHMLFESGTETFNRPEFRLHLGVYGTAYNPTNQRLRYDLRLTTAAIDGTGKPVPTLAWLPLPGFGALPTLAVDRFLIEYDLYRRFTVTAGRFPSPYAGTEMLFDRDYHFQGLSQRLRVDQFFEEESVFRRLIPRLELIAVQSYLAESNIGLQSIETKVPPVYLGAQFRMDFAPFESVARTPEGRLPADITSDIEFRVAAGIHWYDGEEKFAENLGLGYIPGTTNILDASGKVQSQFMIGEAYGEVLFMRTRRARLRAWFHGVFNFHAVPQVQGQDEKNDVAFDAGIAYGMERLEERWDFQVLLRYFYIEADAVVPEFNNEARNTNIKGWEVEFNLRVFPPLTAFAIFTHTERENYELNGFGLPSKDDPNRSAGQSFRMRLGFFLEF